MLEKVTKWQTQKRIIFTSISITREGIDPPAVRIRVNQENMNSLKYMKVHHKWLEASKDKFQDSSYFDFFWVVNMVTVKFCVQIHFPLIVRFLKLTFLWLSNLQDNFPLIVRFSKWSFLWLSDIQKDLSSDCPIFKITFPLFVRFL